MTCRTAPMIATVLLTAAPVLTAAPAAAVGPPPIEDRLLPPAGPAASRFPTEQFATCATAPVVAAGVRRDRPELRAAWARTRGAGQTVAVIDTGVARHRLLPHLVPGGDYVADGDGTADCDGHGTIVAGIIGAAPDPAGGFSGIAPDAAILAIRQSSTKFRASEHADGGDGVGDVESLAAAVRSAADQGATVINISSVACLAVGDALDDRALGAALAYAVDTRNVVVVAAAGNVGGQGTCPKQNPLPAAAGGPDWDRVEVVASPSWYDDLVLTVGSVDADGAPSDFTLAGPWVDVAAPAEAVISLNPAGEGLTDTMPGHVEPQPISGTSYAAPMVSGVAALLRAVAPQLTARQVMHRIESTARHPVSGWNPLVGHGVVDALAAMRGIAAPAPTSAARPLARPPAVLTEAEPGRFALVGAAVCAVLAVASAALRSRRGADAVPHDGGTGDTEFGSAR